MIKTTIYIEKYDWTVYAYFSVSCYYPFDIVARMKAIGVPRKHLSRAYRMLASCELDSGLCISNPDTRSSVLVTSHSTSAAEFLDSLTHEISHLAQHISSACNISKNSEDFCYIAGDVAKALHPYCRKLLCDCQKGRRLS